jgi:thiamine kinase-like enzyme
MEFTEQNNKNERRNEAHGLPVSTETVHVDSPDFSLTSCRIIRQIMPHFFHDCHGDVEVERVTEGSGSADVEADAQQLHYKVIVGGITNQIVLISNAKFPNKKVIMRVFGVGTEEFIDRHNESKVFMELSQRGMGPALHGFFANGRLEGYIPGRNIEPFEMSHPRVFPAIARSMARFHNESVDIERECFVFVISVRLMTVLKQLLAGEDAAVVRKVREQLDEFDVFNEFEWYQSALRERLAGGSAATDSEASAYFAAGQVFGQEIVLCHNDILPGNIMIDPPNYEELEGDVSVTFIDYEYGAYNCRGFDLANHFIGKNVFGDALLRKYSSFVLYRIWWK